MIILKKEPRVFKHVLRVIVSDHCDKTAPLELTVTVTDTDDVSIYTYIEYILLLNV